MADKVHRNENHLKDHEYDVKKYESMLKETRHSYGSLEYFRQKDQGFLPNVNRKVSINGNNCWNHSKRGSEPNLLISSSNENFNYDSKNLPSIHILANKTGFYRPDIIPN